MAKKARIQTFFSAAARSYDAHAVVQRQSFDHLVSLVTGQPRLILDIGCGTGTHTMQLAARFPNARITGIDIAPGMIAVARTHPNPGNVTWVVGDAESQLPGSGYELIVANAALHWFDDLPRTLPNIVAHRSSAGQFVFTLFGASTYQELRAAIASVQGQPVVLASDEFSTPQAVADVVRPLVGSVSVTQQLIRICYPSVFDVLRAIKQTGTRGPNNPNRVWTPRFLQAVETAYRATYGQIWVTHQVYYVDCR